MTPFTSHTGRAALLDREDVDTDQIIPKQFLTRVQKSGYGPFAFFNWRYAEETICLIDPQEGDYRFQKTVLNPDFDLNRPEFKGASILIARNNFGCGSSREHAVWAIKQDGYQVVIAPSKGDLPAFADIFRNNSFKTGLLTIELAAEEVNQLFQRVNENPELEIEVDLPQQQVRIAGEQPVIFRFEINHGIKSRLLKGVDDIGKTLKKDDEISTHEERLPSWV